MLHVEPEHRGKGLATEVVLLLSRDLSRKNIPRYCHVGAENPASIKLHEKCGFEIANRGDIASEKL